MWNTTCPHFHHTRLGLNPYREIVFRSTSQIAGVRTVNRLFAPFSDVRKKKGLRISADPSSRMRKIGFIVVLLRGCLFCSSVLEESVRKFCGGIKQKRPCHLGRANKKLDREGARMYTYGERMRAVKAYIASGYQANKTIQELGYQSYEALRG